MRKPHEMNPKQLAAWIATCSVQEIKQMDDDVLAIAIKNEIFDVGDLRDFHITKAIACKAFDIQENGIKVTSTSLSWPQVQANEAAAQIKRNWNATRADIIRELNSYATKLDQTMTQHMLRFFSGNREKGEAMYVRLNQHLLERCDVQVEAGDDLAEWSDAIDKQRAKLTERWDCSAAGLGSR